MEENKLVVEEEVVVLQLVLVLGIRNCMTMEKVVLSLEIMLLEVVVVAAVVVEGEGEQLELLERWEQR